MPHTDAVILVPGLFGFDSFGDPPDRISYFDRVADQLAAATGWDSKRFLVHKPSPTGPLWLRVSSLYQTIGETLATPIDGRVVDRVHLIGHSTGGVDIRLLTNTHYAWPGGPSAAQRQKMRSRIASVIPVSAPLHGTPIARRLRGAMEFIVPDLFLLSILAKRQTAVRIPEQLLLVYTSLLQAVSTGGAGAGALRFLGGIPPAAAKEVQDFLDRIIASHPLIHELTPVALADLNAAIAGGDFEPIDCFVTVAPRPAVWDGIVAGLGIPKLQWAIYAFSYWATLPEDGEQRAFPKGPWVGADALAAELATDTATDGVVPAASQTVDGRATGIVAGDHLDVVGHFESPTFDGTTVFKSGADFDDDRFAALWNAVAAVLQR